MRFLLGLQVFASKKGVGSTKNGRDSESKRLGAKKADGQFTNAGSIIYRQRGTKIHAGQNVGRGGDDTLFALVAGIVKFEKFGKNRTRAVVIAHEEAAKKAAPAKKTTTKKATVTAAA